MMWLTFPTDITAMATYYPILILVWSYVMSLYGTAPGLSLVRLQCETIVVQSVHQSSTPVVHRHFQSKRCTDATLNYHQASHCLHILFCYRTYFRHFYPCLLYTSDAADE